MNLLRHRLISCAALLSLALAGCSRSDRETRRPDPAPAVRPVERPVERPVDPPRNAPARSVGRTAYRVAQGSKKAARVAGRKIAAASREARAGWKEAQRTDQNRPRNQR